MAKANAKKVRASEAELKDKLVAINRVTKVTKGGRNFSFSAIVVVGDENGVVGHGLGKANEVTEAITKGIDVAKKNCIKVPILNGTIPYYDPTVFDPSTDSYDANAKSYNFELDPSEQSELIIRILAYAGVVIKQADVAQFALGKEQKLETTEQ